MKLKIERLNKSNYTNVHNRFIDDYIEEANGEYIKVYLVLLRLYGDDTLEASSEAIAKRLELTEEKVIKAISYWADKGLVNLGYVDGNISSLVITDDIKEPEESKLDIDILEEKHIDVITPQDASEKDYSKQEISTFLANKDIEEMFYTIHKYLGRIISSREYSKFLYMYNELGLTTAVIEYIVEYAIERGTDNINYMMKVAIDWSEKGICTLEEAKKIPKTVSNEVSYILDALGVRYNATSIHKSFAEEWINKLGVALVYYGCELATDRVSKPTIKHVKAFLSSWIDNGIKTVEEAKAYEARNKTSVKSEHTQSFKAAKARSMFDFQQREYTEEQMLAIRLGATNETR